MLYIIKRSVLFLSFNAILLSAMAQVKQLTDDNYFKGNLKGIIQPLPIANKWVDDSHFLLIKDGKTFVVDAKSGNQVEQTSPASGNPQMPGSASQPGVYNKNNDLYIRINNQEIQLTNTVEKELNPAMSPDRKYVAFTRNNDLYTINIDNKKESRLTNDGSDVILNGYSSWVYMEEILGRPTQHRAFWWSPDSRHLAFFRSDDTNVPLFTITDGNKREGYVETVRYPKVGDKNPEVRIGIVAPEGNKVVWSDFDQKEDQYFGKPYWKLDGSGLLVQWMNRKQNLLKIWNVNPATGNKIPFYTEEQKTWITLDDDRINLLENGGLLLFSDATGWNHIYRHDMNGKLINQVTKGKFTVSGIEHIDEKNSIIYFTARGLENTARQDLYKIGFDGKNQKRLTFGDYSHINVNLSPDASYFITVHNNAGNPSRITLVDNNGKIIKELGDAKGADFSDYQLAKTEVVRVKSEDGLYDLPMKITWPLNMDKSKKYPVLISAYGGPNSTTLMDTWSITGNQQWYAKEGLIQVSMDHRASGHFGKEGVNYMYHNLGFWEIKDYSTMVKWLVENGSADPTKIAITGFSYGGYLSAYALTYGADVFTHGMAGGTVADWSLYDTHYTERFMGTMADNEDGYKKSSVLTYADKYKGMLQLVHGVIDENVHLQNTIQIASLFQDKKKDFEMMIYSGGRHGWGGNKNLHFQNLKTKFIYRYLLEKPVPKGALK